MNYDMNIQGIEKEIAPIALPKADEASSSDRSFKNVLHDLVSEVDSLQKDANSSINGLITGETTNIHDVTIKMEEAGIAFELMMEIRSKLLDAYQQIIKMQ